MGWNRGCLFTAFHDGMRSIGGIMGRTVSCVTGCCCCAMGRIASCVCCVCRTVGSVCGHVSCTLRRPFGCFCCRLGSFVSGTAGHHCAGSKANEGGLQERFV